MVSKHASQQMTSRQDWQDFVEVLFRKLLCPLSSFVTTTQNLPSGQDVPIGHEGPSSAKHNCHAYAQYCHPALLLMSMEILQ